MLVAHARRRCRMPRAGEAAVSASICPASSAAARRSSVAEIVMPASHRMEAGEVRDRQRAALLDVERGRPRRSRSAAPAASAPPSPSPCAPAARGSPGAHVRGAATSTSGRHDRPARPSRAGSRTSPPPARGASGRGAPGSSTRIVPPAATRSCATLRLRASTSALSSPNAAAPRGPRSRPSPSARSSRPPPRPRHRRRRARCPGRRRASAHGAPTLPSPIHAQRRGACPWRSRAKSTQARGDRCRSATVSTRLDVDRLEPRAESSEACRRGRPSSHRRHQRIHVRRALDRRAAARTGSARRPRCPPPTRGRSPGRRCR